MKVGMNFIKWKKPEMVSGTGATDKIPEILKEKGYSDFVSESVLYHHENFDGSGYPDNLKEFEIPIGARILRVCDVFAALISDRPYRSAFDVDAAVELMIEEVKNFDMEVFLAFMRVVNSENSLRLFDI